MAATAIRAHGTSITAGGSAIGGVTSVTSPSLSVNLIDTTAFDTTGGYRTKMAGLIDPGDMTISGKADPDDTGQEKLIDSIGDAPIAFVITYKSGDTCSFNGIVGNYVVSGDDDGDLTFSATVHVTGAVTWGGGA